MSTTKATNTFVFSSQDNLSYLFKALQGIKSASVKFYPLPNGGIHWSTHIFRQRFNVIQHQICSTERNSSTPGGRVGQTTFHAYLERVEVLVFKKKKKKAVFKSANCLTKELQIQEHVFLLPIPCYPSLLLTHWKKTLSRILQHGKLLKKTVCWGKLLLNHNAGFG